MCMLRLSYERDICLVIYLSISNIVIEKRKKNWKSVHDTIGRCLGYMHAEAVPDRHIV